VTGGVIFKKSKIVLQDMASVFGVAAYVLLCVCCYLFWDGSCVGFLVWKLWSVGRRGVFVAGGVFKSVSKIMLRNMVCSSFKWLLFRYSA